MFVPVTVVKSARQSMAQAEKKPVGPLFPAEGEDKDKGRRRMSGNELRRGAGGDRCLVARSLPVRCFFTPFQGILTDFAPILGEKKDGCLPILNEACSRFPLPPLPFTRSRRTAYRFPPVRADRPGRSPRPPGRSLPTARAHSHCGPDTPACRAGCRRRRSTRRMRSAHCR